MTSIVVGLVGLRHGKRHIQSFLDIPDVKIGGICDIRTDRLQMAAKEYGISDNKLYQSFDQLLTQKEVEAVMISVPNDLHMPLGMQALDSGYHVLMNKPIAHKVEDMNEE